MKPTWSAVTQTIRKWAKNWGKPDWLPEVDMMRVLGFIFRIIVICAVLTGAWHAFIWLVSAFVLIGLLTATIFLGYPYYSKGHQAVDIRQKELRNLLAKDYFLLKSWLADPLDRQNKEAIRQVMQRFFNIQQKTAIPYTGLVLLGTDRKVVCAYSTKADRSAGNMIGSSYAAIEFQGSEDSLHKVLTVYRTEKDHPMGKKRTEIAFELYNNNALMGWLVFQMDMDALADTYGIDDKNLKNLQFDKP